ncbi:hypothetical protein PUN28_014525 [Cardiocondyla obscurior]|uniref:Uncharacterized protein n=1 Tax=Cardiocondyla obscurior TaxID=286306 RepID=A0AAW2F3R6_9HYME
MSLSVNACEVNLLPRYLASLSTALSVVRFTATELRVCCCCCCPMPQSKSSCFNASNLAPCSISAKIIINNFFFFFFFFSLHRQSSSFLLLRSCFRFSTGQNGTRIFSGKLFLTAEKTRHQKLWHFSFYHFLLRDLRRERSNSTGAFRRIQYLFVQYHSLQLRVCNAARGDVTSRDLVAPVVDMNVIPQLLKSVAPYREYYGDSKVDPETFFLVPFPACNINFM